MNARSILIGIALLTAGACSPQSDSEVAAGSPDTITPSVEPAGPVASGDGWVVSPAGSGPLRIGMTLAEMAPHLATDVDTASLQENCDYVRAAEAPDSMLFMVETGRLVRVDVTGGSTATPEGARVGDPESRILSLYPAAVRGPHKYTDGAYLTVAGSGADSISKLVFETDGQRVTRYRAGVAPAVEYVEGCS